MKQELSVSNFLLIKVAKDNQAPSELQTEVLAIAPEKDQGGKSASEKKSSFVLDSSFKDYFELVHGLVERGELSTKSPHGCLVRYGGIRGGSHALVIGTGHDRHGINALGPVERMRRLGAHVAHKLSAEKIKDAYVYLDSFLLLEADLPTDPCIAAYAFLEGAGLANYHFKKYITEKSSKKESVPSITLASSDPSHLSAYAKGAGIAKAMLEGTFIARDLGNEPSNNLYPAKFGDQAKALAKSHGFKCTVLDEKILEKEKMGLLLGVGQGSSRPPRLIVMEYAPAKSKNKKMKTIAFVGKGITFDSGGISIKPSARMEDMKHDMCGGAAVVGALVCAANLELDVRIIGIVAAAENMPDGNAINPGNILVSRAGKTVEISNTDAEGRLVLADALDYVQDMKPDYIIDLATLTGAITITLGKTCAGLMGNNEGFNQMIEAAAASSGERVWPLPLFDEYFDDLKSEYADLRNSGDTPSHGSAKGAMFLQEFIRKGTKWAHLDIAAMAYAVGFVPYYPKKSSTGYGVRLLVELAKKLE